MREKSPRLFVIFLKGYVRMKDIAFYVFLYIRKDGTIKRKRSFRRIYAIVVFIIVATLMITNFKIQKRINEYENSVMQMRQEYESIQRQNEIIHEQLKEIKGKFSFNSGGQNNENLFIVTAYDLSVQSCGKTPDHPAYGITATGKNLAGHTLETAMTIAVDPEIIPLGSKVYLEFEDDFMQDFNGIYKAEDTGSAIQGNRIDLFVGEDNYDLAMNIGRKKAHAKVL